MAAFYYFWEIVLPLVCLLEGKWKPVVVKISGMALQIQNVPYFEKGQLCASVQWRSVWKTL